MATLYCLIYLYLVFDREWFRWLALKGLLSPMFWGFVFSFLFSGCLGLASFALYRPPSNPQKPDYVVSKFGLPRREGGPDITKALLQGFKGIWLAILCLVMGCLGLTALMIWLSQGARWN